MAVLMLSSFYTLTLARIQHRKKSPFPSLSKSRSPDSGLKDGGDDEGEGRQTDAQSSPNSIEIPQLWIRQIVSVLVTAHASMK